MEVTSDGYKIVPQNNIYDIRCAHTEHGRPPADEDVGSERHWRCRARFEYLPFLVHDWQRIYCPQHQPFYRPGDLRASTTEVSQALDLYTARTQARALILQESADAESLDQRKREQLARAARAGLIREPGEEG